MLLTEYSSSKLPDHEKEEQQQMAPADDDIAETLMAVDCMY